MAHLCKMALTPGAHRSVHIIIVHACEHAKGAFTLGFESGFDPDRIRIGAFTLNAR